MILNSSLFGFQWSLRLQKDSRIELFSIFRFQVQGYPTIKYFPAGVKDYSSALNYDGGRTASDIIAWALDKHAESIDPPEVEELTTNGVLADNCNEKPLCVVSVLPDILDTGADGRNSYINTLKELGEKYKRKLWGWVWTAAGVHSNLEGALGIGGFGYPAMAVVNVRKKVDFFSDRANHRQRQQQHAEFVKDNP